jgi:type II secretory pathway pseudopilin PulG
MVLKLKIILAFTLAEVLITLCIIGVIAEMTIPTLLSNIENAQYVANLKKAYSGLDQVLVKMATDNNCIGDLKCTGLFASGTDIQTFGTELVKYFKILKNCESSVSGGPNISGCFSDSVAQTYNGLGTRSGYMDDPAYYYRFITADGIAFSVRNFGNNCGSNASAYITYNMTQACAYLSIDVNGPTKGPNNLGRDIFWFWITNGKGPLLYPAGGSDDNSFGWWKNDGTCKPSSTAGLLCAGRIIEEGWQMNY